MRKGSRALSRGSEKPRKELPPRPDRREEVADIRGERDRRRHVLRRHVRRPLGFRRHGCKPHAFRRHKPHEFSHKRRACKRHRPRVFNRRRRACKRHRRRVFNRRLRASNLKRRERGLNSLMLLSGSPCRRLLIDQRSVSRNSRQ